MAEPTDEYKWEMIRTARNQRLRESDWAVLEDYPGTKKQDWKAYRKKLRDLPQDYADPDDVICLPRQNRNP